MRVICLKKVVDFCYDYYKVVVSISLLFCFTSSIFGVKCGFKALYSTSCFLLFPILLIKCNQEKYNIKGVYPIELSHYF